MLRSLLAFAAASLALSASAAAAPVVRSQLPAACAPWAGNYVIAVSCDPLRQARAIRLQLGAAHAEGSKNAGIEQLGGAEPLLPGETLMLTWTRPSARAVLAVYAMAPRGPHWVVLALPDAPPRVDVIAQSDGSLQVTTPTGQLTVPPPPAPADIQWQPRTAHEAAARLLAAVDRMERSEMARRTLCAALDRDVFSLYDLALDDPEYGCPSALELRIFGDEDVPRPTSTVHHGFALAVSRGRATLATRLTHRYDPYAPDDKRRLVVRARILLVRDASGVWRLGTVEPLLPLVAVDHPSPFTDAELQHIYRWDVTVGRKSVAHQAHRQAQRQAASVASSAQAPCAVAMSRDGQGDVTAQGSDERARDQAAHAGVDMVSVGAAGRCVGLRTREPLPASFTVQLHDTAYHELVVTVTDGRAVVEDTSNGNEEPKILKGLVAHLEADTLVLALPVSFTGRTTVLLDTERAGLSYDDEATR
ncbi:MAG TPA: hypothetical protein VF257_05180 [Solirubrobacteraceae bacterium]